MCVKLAKLIKVHIYNFTIHQSDDAIPVVDLDSSTLWPINVDQTRSAKIVAMTTATAAASAALALARLRLHGWTNCIHQSDDAIVDLDSSTLWPISVDQTRSAKLVATTTATAATTSSGYAAASATLARPRLLLCSRRSSRSSQPRRCRGRRGRKFAYFSTLKPYSSYNSRSNSLIFGHNTVHRHTRWLTSAFFDLCPNVQTVDIWSCP